MQEFAQYHLNKSSKYEAGTSEELLKGGTFSFNKVLFIPSLHHKETVMIKIRLTANEHLFAFPLSS